MNQSMRHATSHLRACMLLLPQCVTFPSGLPDACVLLAEFFAVGTVAAGSRAWALRCTSVLLS